MIRLYTAAFVLDKGSEIVSHGRCPKTAPKAKSLAIRLKFKCSFQSGAIRMEPSNNAFLNHEMAFLPV
ncbi:hypothetical protein Tco_0340809 [Tanacetum coccineum]